MQFSLLSVLLYFAHWLNLLTLQHLSGYICEASHQCSPCYILLHLILVIHFLPSQSNDEVSEVFVLVEGSEDDSLYYSLEKLTFLPAESASDGSSYTDSACVPDILKLLCLLSPISFLHKPHSFAILFF